MLLDQLIIEYELYSSEENERLDSISGEADALSFEDPCIHSAIPDIGEKIEGCSGIILPENSEIEGSTRFTIYLSLLIDEEDFSSRRNLDGTEAILLDQTVRQTTIHIF